MKIRLLKEFSMLLGAVATLYLATPFLPTALMIQVRDLTVTPEQEVYLSRTVSAPSDGYFSYEIMQQGGKVLPECNRSGRTFYEARGLEPINYTLGCAPLPEGDYEMRMCISAVGPFGIRLRPSCEDTDFVVGADLETRQMQLQEKIILLEELVKTLRGDDNVELNRKAD